MLWMPWPKSYPKKPKNKSLGAFRKFYSDPWVDSKRWYNQHLENIGQELTLYYRNIVQSDRDEADIKRELNFLTLENLHRAYYRYYRKNFLNELKDSKIKWARKDNVKRFLVSLRRFYFYDMNGFNAVPK